MSLTSLLQPGSTLVLPGPVTRDEALAALADKAAEFSGGGMSGPALLELLKRREAQSPTAVPEGVAFPHAIDASITSTALVVGRWGAPIDFYTPVRADLVFAMFGTSAEPWRHVRLLARLARIIRAPGALERLRSAGDAESLRATLLSEDRSHE